MPGERPTSPLIIAELYEAGDAAFLDAMNAYRQDQRPLVGIVERWKKDRSPWARRMKFAFLERDTGSDASQRLICKRLFKQAWHDADHELMGAFMVHFDRLLRRRRGRRHRWANGSYEINEVLYLRPFDGGNPFSTPTTHYLRRRAWRYFRRLGFRQPSQYVPAVADALKRYRDDDVRAGENLLDNWGLMHACFGKSPVLKFSPRHTNLRSAETLASLQPAPMFERHWADASAAAVLMSLVVSAHCRAVRVWAIVLLKRHHAASLTSVDASLLLQLVEHDDADVAAFAAELLASADAVSRLPMATWLRLVETRNVSIHGAIVEAFRRHVSFDRATLSEAVRIATNRSTPVARLGLEILRGRLIRTDDDRSQLAALASARCAAVASEIAGYALPLLNVAGQYDRSRVVAFVDSPLESMRDGSFAALTDESPAATDPAFWAALLESPYDDVRVHLVHRLNDRQSLPGASADALAFLWRSVLLNIHRGGRAKLVALKQLSQRIADEPERAEVLLPVLAVAIRSVRAPEARHGLAAIVSAIDRMPSLAAVVSQYLPELQLDVLPGGVA